MHDAQYRLVLELLTIKVEEDSTSGLVIEVFDDLDKVCADVLLYGCPQSCMPNPVRGQVKTATKFSMDR